MAQPPETACGRRPVAFGERDERPVGLLQQEGAARGGAAQPEAASSSVTPMPAWAKRRAAMAPVMPPPTMTTSVRCRPLSLGYVAGAALPSSQIGRPARSRRWEEVVMSWQVYAVISALAAGATAVLAKVGLEGIPSNLANAVRTAIVLVLSIGVVYATGDQKGFAKLDGRAWLFLSLSGLATAVSWVAYFKALEMGSATPVTAIDKASLVVTWLLSVAFLGEAMGWRAGVGVGLVCVGAFLMSGQK
jgi:transporter family protein